MSESTGVVSVWAGNFESEDELRSYIGTTDDPSRFEDDFEIGTYVDAEGDFLPDGGGELIGAVMEFSSAASFVDELVFDLMEQPDFDSLLLVYDIDASEVTGREGAPMWFVGAYDYEGD
jgi:hypothetical protein